MTSLLAFVFAAALSAEEPKRFHAMEEAQIAAELKAIHAAHPTLEARIEQVSERFLGTKYRLGPLGEGKDGEYDREPLYSFKLADCTTFVEQVMALALEPELEKAKELLQKIRYRAGVVAYDTRKHFPEVDWIPANVEEGFLEDITRRIDDRRTAWAFKTIKKRDWYLSKSTAQLEGAFDEPEPARLARAERWRAVGEKMKDSNARLPYLPLEHLDELLPLVPTGSIGNVVRADLPDKPVIVTHQVLILQKPEGAIVRHAAFGKQVQDEPAAAYFAKFKDAKWRVVGINVNAVLPRAATSSEGPAPK